MKNLIKWEFKQIFCSKVFWGMGITLILINTLFLCITSVTEECTGFDLFLHGCNEFNSFLLFFIGIYAGIHVTGAFEERKIQAAIMAGNSRFKIIAVKMLSFSLSIGACCMFAMIVSLVIASFVEGTVVLVTDLFREIILRMGAYTLVEISSVSLCFLLSMFVKDLGVAIAVNIVAMLSLNAAGQMLLGKEWAMSFLKYTPLGQTFLLLADASTNNLVISVVASIMGLVVTMALSYVKFRREELK